jgi:surface protein
MKKTNHLFITLILALIFNLSFGQTQYYYFLTKWHLPTGQHSVTIPIQTAVTNPTEYAEVVWFSLNSSASGTQPISTNFSGNFTITGLPDDEDIVVSFHNSLLRTFKPGLGSSKDHIIEVMQWGTTFWTNLQQSYKDCINLDVTATDAPLLMNINSFTEMFMGCTSLTGNNFQFWSASNIQTFTNMFANCSNFNGNISNWNMSNSSNLVGMLQNCSSFDRPLYWNMSATACHNMLDNCGMSCENYTNTLHYWANTVTVGNNKTVGAFNVGYSANAATAARNTLITNKNWTIVGDAAASPDCYEGALIPNFFLTHWQLPNWETSFSFYGTVVGTGADYYWQTIPPSANEGMGTLSAISGGFTISGLPAGAKIRFGIVTDNLKEFYVASSSASYLENVEQWGTAEWTSTAGMFNGATALDISATDIPNFSQVQNMYQMFSDCYSLQGNATMALWNTANVTDMTSMFYNCLSFNQDIGAWNTGNVESMANMFTNSPFNQPIGNWNTSNVEIMFEMFKGASAFNQNINTWDVSKVTWFLGMFESSNFNQPLDQWQLNTNPTANIYLDRMFMNNPQFNQDISSWNTSRVVNTSFMFMDATSFNQDISNWNTQRLQSLTSMFSNASSFDQYLGDWNFPLLNFTANPLIGLFNNSGMSCENYSSTLIGWNNQASTPDNMSLDALNISYGTNAVAARTNLINTKNWTITGDVNSGADCSINCAGTSAPAGNSSQTFCAGTMLQDVVVSGTNIKWYDSPTGGNQLATNHLLSSGFYYASQSSGPCESPTRLEVEITVITTPAPTAPTPQQFCDYAVVEDLVATGIGLNWYDDEFSAQPIAAGTGFFMSTTVYVSSFDNGCESERIPVGVGINQHPPAPNGNPAQHFCTEATVSDITLNGFNHIYYDEMTGGNALSPTTPLENETYYFASQTIDGCESTSRFAVMVFVSLLDNSTTFSNNTLSANQNSATYQWVNCDNGNAPISGATSQAFTPNTNGNYAVIVSNNNCSVTSECFAITTANTLEQQQTLFSIFPNPSNGIVHVTSDQQLMIEIITIDGKIVEQTIINQYATLNIAHLANGVYFIKAGEHIVKFIKE